MDTYPAAKPIAKYCPSLVHAQQFTLPPDLCFWTAFCSEDQKAMSDMEQLSSWWDTGLNCIDWTASLWLKTIIYINFLKMLRETKSVDVFCWNSRIFQYSFQFRRPNYHSFVRSAWCKLFTVSRITHAIYRVLVTWQKEKTFAANLFDEIDKFEQFAQSRWKTEKKKKRILTQLLRVWIVLFIFDGAYLWGAESRHLW